MASHLKTAQESAIRGGAFSYGCFCTVSCRAGLICCVFFPRVQCCARRGKPSCPNSPSCYTYLSMPCSFLFCIMRRRRSAASAVSFHVFSSRLPYVFGTRVAPAIYLCSLSPVCLRRLLSRSDGRSSCTRAAGLKLLPGLARERTLKRCPHHVGTENGQM